MTIARIVKFFRTYFLKHPLYVLTYGVLFFLKNAKFNIHFYTAYEIESFLKEGKSLIRLGDGEINLLLGLENYYHAFSPKLKMMMEEIIKSYSVTSPYVLSVPRFLNFSNRELKDIGKFHVWMPLKTIFLLMFPKKVAYMDAHNFYYDNYFENNIAPIFKDKIIICVTKKETIEKQKNNKNIPWKNIWYVEVPERDVLSVYEEIKRRIEKELCRFNKKDIVLFVAMGPVGKYLIFEYANRGYQGIDIGRGLEVVFTNESIEHLST